MMNLTKFENESFPNHNSISKVITDILLLKRDAKEIVQYPLIEFSAIGYLKLNEFCKRNNIKIAKIIDDFSKEEKIILFKRKNINFYKEQLKKHNDKVRGELFGYPLCCIQNLKNLKKEKSLFSTHNLQNLNLTKNFKINLTNNYFLFDSCFRLFSHYPCTTNCKHTSQIAKETLRGVKEWNLDIYKKYLEINKKYCLYFNSTGMRIYFDGLVKNNKINYSDLIINTRTEERTLKLDEIKHILKILKKQSNNSIEVDVLVKNNISIVQIKEND